MQVTRRRQREREEASHTDTALDRCQHELQASATRSAFTHGRHTCATNAWVTPT